MDERAELQAAIAKGVSDGIPEVELAVLRERLVGLGGGWGAAVPAVAPVVVPEPVAAVQAPVENPKPAVVKVERTAAKAAPVAKKRK